MHFIAQITRDNRTNVADDAAWAFAFKPDFIITDHLAKCLLKRCPHVTVAPFRTVVSSLISADHPLLSYERTRVLAHLVVAVFHQKLTILIYPNMRTLILLRTPLELRTR